MIFNCLLFVVVAHIVSMTKKDVYYGTVRVDCIANGSRPFWITWATNATNVSYVDDGMLVGMSEGYVFVTCTAQNEFGYQEKTVSFSKSQID